MLASCVGYFDRACLCSFYGMKNQHGHFSVVCVESACAGCRSVAGGKGTPTSFLTVTSTRWYDGKILCTGTRYISIIRGIPGMYIIIK